MRRTEFLTEKREFHGLHAGLLMEGSVVSCKSTDLGRHIASQLANHNIGSVPIVDKNEMIVGLVSEFDLLQILMEGRELDRVMAEEVMTREVKTIQEDTPVDEIIRLMDTHHLIRMPVVKDGKLIGMMARRDLLFGYIKATAEYWP